MTDKLTIADLGKYPVDRIGLGFCRMNCFEWDEELFGPPPEGWDKLGPYARYQHPEFRYYSDLIDDILPEKMKSMYWWTIELERTYKEWEEWYEGKKKHKMGGE